MSDKQLQHAEKRARQNLKKPKRNTESPRTLTKCHRGPKPHKSKAGQAFAWKHNALRHSFISYRVAEIQNVAQVALEAGNSPQMIFQHYRELVRPAEAKAWFAIEPKDGDK